MMAMIILELALSRHGNTGSDDWNTTPQSKAGSSSKTMQQMDELMKSTIKEKLEGKESDRSKFTKVEKPMFVGEEPDSGLFRAKRYFQTHKLFEETQYCSV